MTNARVSAVSIFFGLFALVLIGRLFYWQVIKAEELSEQARYQHERGRQIIAPRGNILASDGTWLAASEDAWLVTGMKPDIKNIREAIYTLAPIFVDDPNNKEELGQEIKKLEDLLQNPQAVWVPLKHKISTEKKKKIEEADFHWHLDAWD